MQNVKPLRYDEMLPNASVLMAVPCSCRIWSKDGLTIGTIEDPEGDSHFLHCRIVAASVPYLRVVVTLHDDRDDKPTRLQLVCDTRNVSFWIGDEG